MVTMVFPLLLLLAAPANAAQPDLSQSLSRWKQVRMGSGTAGLTPRQKQVVDRLVEASRCLESIYWRQADPAGLELLISTKNRELKRALMINGSRFDLVGGNRPLVPGARFLPGRNLYPPELTSGEIEAYVRAHPEQKKAIYSPFTVIRREGRELKAIPYHVEFRRFLEPAAKLLREAAAASDDAAFANFLRLRADALLTDDYYPSDLAWVDLRSPKIDLIFAPYETYLDDVLGVKTSFESAVLIRNEEESRKLSLYQKYVPEIQDALPLGKPDLPSKQGQVSPMEVVDAPFRAGDLRHGYQAVADNLPNDERVHESKGTKKIFFKNFMDARVDFVVLPLARQVMREDQAKQASAAGYMAAVILHEISHGLGPSYARVNGQRKSIREAIGPAYGGLEEAKADVTGMFALKWLVDRGVLPKERLPEFYASYVAGIFRTVRYGIAEAHGRAEMMEFNFLAGQGAIVRAGGTYRIDFAKMPDALAKLTRELLEIEAAGDRMRAENWFNRYDKMPPELAAALAGVKDVPVDIDPVFAYPETVH
jgi:hypothetical protein